MKGIELAILKITQKSTTIRNPSFILISFLAEILGKYKIEPSPKIIKNE